MENEKPQIKKLRFMGLLLLFFAGLTFAYTFIPQPVDEKIIAEEDFSLEVAEIPPIDPYVIIASFVAVGLTCILLSYKKTKALKS